MSEATPAETAKPGGGDESAPADTTKPVASGGRGDRPDPFLRGLDGKPANK